MLTLAWRCWSHSTCDVALSVARACTVSLIVPHATSLLSECTAWADSVCPGGAHYCSVLYCCCITNATVTMCANFAGMRVCHTREGGGGVSKVQRFAEVTCLQGLLFGRGTRLVHKVMGMAKQGSIHRTMLP
jgi:hypothetical protein